MALKELNKDDYYYFFFKSTCWVLGNVAFGLLPLLFMYFVYWVSNYKVGKDEIQHLIHDGVILFVCLAIIGSVLVELILSGQKAKISMVILLLIIPIFVFILILTDYFLINLKIIDTSVFDISSLTSKIVIVFTLYFCIFTKASLYIKEETKHDTV